MSMTTEDSAISIPLAEDNCTVLSQSNSNSNGHDSGVDDSAVVSTLITANNSGDEIDGDDDIDSEDFYARLIALIDHDSDSDDCFNDSDNDDIYLSNHVDQKQLRLIEYYDKKTYQRAKRSNKKMSARLQIKTKHAKNIRIKSHNKQLYMNHRLCKRAMVDSPRLEFLPSTPPAPLYSNESLRAIVKSHRQSPTIFNSQQAPPHTTQANVGNANFRMQDYVINEHNIPHDASFDDNLIAFLFDMQNRDLSPNDYEMLLRLDERIQRKTVNKNILDKLPTSNVSEMHLNDQCTICMEPYALGQDIKTLPCSHIFHLNCIETYLKDFSVQCPLDNIPLI